VVASSVAYDEDLAARVREVVAERPGVSEQKMFGGVAFMLHGNMCVGVHDDDLIVRLSEDDAAEAIRDPAARPMDFTGKPMTSWLYVAPSGTVDERSLRAWIDLAAGYVSTLPPKAGRTMRT
jgi:TfoX/Sxy family transcriptional regulator of competence genes